MRINISFKALSEECMQHHIAQKIGSSHFQLHDIILK